MSTTEGGGTRFVVQWEEHPVHLTARLGQLLEQQTLVDVTLMCNTHTLRVHRSVLAACSPYFENLLMNISQRQLIQHPLIVLKDMQFPVLKCIIEFMYCGETNVTEDDLGPLLQAARFFQVKGLSSMTKEALGLPSRPTKAAVNGQVHKTIPAPKPSPKPVTPMTSKTLTTVSGTTNIAAKPQPIKTFAVRESPGLRPSSSEPAELLLSLSGEGGGQTKTVQHQQTKVPIGPTGAKQVVSQQQRSWTTRPIGAAVDSSFQLAPNQPEGSSPVYQPGPRKRGRPLKRQMNLIFQEKVISDAEMALRKEEEASRYALHAIHEQMFSSESDEAESPQMTQQQQSVKQQPATQQANLVMKSKLVPISQQSKTVSKKADASSSSAAGTNEADTSAEGSTITYQISDTGNSQSVMSQYMEVLKEAGLPTDVPILMDSGDGNYVTVNEEVLMNIVNGGGLQYQVTEESLHEVRKQEGELLSGDQQMHQQVVRYMDDNGEIVEGVLAVVQEGEEGTTVAVTPSGQVLQIQSAGDGETYQIVEDPAEGSNEGLISGDLEPQTTSVESPGQSTKRAVPQDSTKAKKSKADESSG